MSDYNEGAAGKLYHYCPSCGELMTYALYSESEWDCPDCDNPNNKKVIATIHFIDGKPYTDNQLLLLEKDKRIAELEETLKEEIAKNKRLNERFTSIKTTSDGN